jgi:primosomal protein N' (replication factor Y)
MSSKLKQGSAGSTRWAEQLGKSFPGIPVREISVTTSETRIANRPSIVVCTPGIEPVAEGGYAGVALLDCFAQLSIDSLRAPEDALRSWLNALAFMRPGGEAVAVGVTSEVSAALSLGEISKTISEILEERELLGFPPAKRFLSATGTRSVVEDLGQALKSLNSVKVLGISQAQSVASGSDCRLVVSFSYAEGAHVADVVRTFLASLGSKQVRTSIRSGKNVRPLSIKFDDPRVI